MRAVIQFFTIYGLIVCVACGQEKTGSVKSVLAELSSRTTPRSEVNVSAVPSGEKSSPVAVPFVAKAKENTIEPVDVPAVVEKSRKQYISGNYTEAEAGFKAALAADPENRTAAFYLNRLICDDRRSVEESVLKKAGHQWDMILRYYPVTERLVKSMKLEGEGSLDIKLQLEKASIDFPEGSSVRYLPEIRKLFVENTPANLSRLEEILATFGEAEVAASDEQVEILTRFVEFSEGALQELGFHWSNPDFGDTYKLAGNEWKIGSATEPGQNLFSDSLRSVPFNQTENLGAGETRANGEWSANRIEDMFSTQAGTLGIKGNVAGNPVDLLIKTLDQTAGVDVLSTPSVVTLSGQEATITVGERHFFPGSYDAGETVGTVLHVMYNDFADKILGVEMKVTPVIKGDEILMKINPKITELAGWQKFQLAPKDTSYTYYQYRVGMQFNHDPVVAQLPLFNRREVRTEISAASGSTIGMGGLIGEKKETFSDRVPVLGSIPLIGRLFRSEGERNVKRNLMILVTATKVAPDGRMISERSFER